MKKKPGEEGSQEMIVTGGASWLISLTKIAYDDFLKRPNKLYYTCHFLNILRSCLLFAVTKLAGFGIPKNLKLY